MNAATISAVIHKDLTLAVTLNFHWFDLEMDLFNIDLTLALRYKQRESEIAG